VRAGKSWICLVLTVILTVITVSSGLACEHIDSGEGYIMWNSYVSPTETSDGSTGPGTCSVCGAVVQAASSIPKLATQRQVSNPEPPPPPTDPPAPVTDPPAPPPADPPAQQPADPPAQQPNDPPAQQPVQQATDLPAPVQAPASTPAPTQVPTAVPAPASIPATTPVPGPVQPAGENNGGGITSQATPQPNLAEVNAPQDGGNNSASREASSGGGENSGGPGPQSRQTSTGRRQGRFPDFSTRFPWRRLRMTPQPGIEVRIAGDLVWPLPESSSPLMTLLNP